jgi:FAD/FMN-containing dehydrogenase
MTEASTATRYDIGGLVRALGDIPVVSELTAVRRRSRDFFWYSPILNTQLHGKAADIGVVPRNEGEVVEVLAQCHARRIPVTPRGAGTGNYGQAVPLEGGVLLELNGLDKIAWTKPGMARVGVGVKMHVIDAATVSGGWELRMHPSTKRMATIGGFIAGGSGGVGSVTWGGLREPGNISAARILTMEEKPRAIELRGAEVNKIARIYGTTGIITELEVPLAPAYRWVELILAFDDFFEAVRVGHEVALADGIVKKLLTPISWPLPIFFDAVRAACPEGMHVLIAMIAEPSLEAFKALVGRRGTITLERAFDESATATPLYEYTWNHTTLHVLRTDRGVTYLQCLFPHDRLMEKVREIHALFGDEVLLHLEFIRFAGRVTCSALPVVRFSTAERLNEIIRLHEAAGVSIANPHVYTLEDGSRHKWIDADQLGFKRQVDPLGLLNPGKMRTFSRA